MKKKQLNYSALTDKVYWVDGKGEKHDVTQNFIQMVLLYLNEAETPKAGESHSRDVCVGNKVHFELTCKCIILK